ncbi:MAG: hypothetical protein AXA67_05975 [Methylothermaceae bacteria B42]|nr:MAG: hypothetical protein AXA67_05975 [Methylothermaceae bacteria B42]HHJ40386.1 hypothetical protein [Methylothermaceae bacterium]
MRQAIFASLAVVLLLAYPFLMQSLAERGWHGFLPWLLAGILGWRALRVRSRAERWLWAGLSVALVIGVLWLGPVVTKTVPGVTFLLLAWVFGRTLRSLPPLIERMVRLQFKDIPPHLLAYTRRLTQIWTVFFVLLALLSFALTWLASEQVWTWFHGIGIYLLIGLLMLGEYLYRRWRFPDLDRAPPPHETLREVIKHGKSLWKNS